MHIDKVILLMDRWSDGLSTRPYDPNTLTRQSNGTKDSPRYPLLGHVTWYTDQYVPLSAYFYVYV